MNNLEILLNLLVHPHYALKRKDKSLGLSVLVLIVSLWSWLVSNYLIQGISVSSAAFSINIISLFIITLLFVIVSVSLWHFISESFKGEGKATELFLCICLSFLPLIFLTPMALIVKFSHLALSFYMPFSIAIVVWVVTLKILSLKIVYGLNGPLATLTYFIPFIVIFAIYILLLILIVSFLMITASQALMPFLEL